MIWHVLPNTYHKILNAVRIPTPNGKDYTQYNFNTNGQLLLPYDIIRLLIQNKFYVYNLIGKHKNIVSVHGVE